MKKISPPKKAKIAIALDALVLDALDKAVANLPGISRSEYVNQTLAMALIDKGFIKTISNSPGGSDLPNAADTAGAVSVKFSAPSPCGAARDADCLPHRGRARVRLGE